MKKYVPFIMRIVVAIILVQTLRFKFLGHPDSIYIFETVGMEPYGRIGTGIIELLAAILLLVRPTVYIGAAIAIGVMAGAIFMHLTILGVEVKNDGGMLFILAIATFTLSSTILYLHRKDIPLAKWKSVLHI